MAKLMSIKEESDELRRTTNDRMAQAKDQFDVFQNEVETKMTIIGDTLVTLKEGMQEANTAIETRMASQESAILNLANKLDHMFKAMEEKWGNSTNAPSWHGPGNGSDWYGNAWSQGGWGNWQPEPQHQGQASILEIDPDELGEIDPDEYAPAGSTSAAAVDPW